MNRQRSTRYDADSEDEASDIATGYPDEWYPRMPKSALRVRDTTDRSVITSSGRRFDIQQGAPPPKVRRASLNQPATEQGNGKQTEDLQRRWRPHPLLIVGIMLIVAILGYLVLTTVGTWLTNTENHWQYGYPRTFQCDEVVGHHDSPSHPTHFIATNVNGEIDVIEFPGGDTHHARIYTGVSVIGQNPNLLPVTLSFQDVNGDGTLDMIVTVGNSHYVFLNKNGQFVEQ